MGHTHSRLLYHFIWGTHKRTKWIKPAMEAELHAYLTALLSKNGAHVYKVNGMEEHVHCVLQMKTEPSVAKVIKDAKSYSSGWMKRRFGVRNFTWQAGSAPFTISPSRLQETIDYVRDQKEHHRHKTFEEEYLEFLRKYGVEFDPDTVFD